MKRWSFLLLAPVALAATPAADPAPYVRDVAHSQINFVAEARLVSAHGTFDAWDAEILFDADKIEASSLTITIDAKSINTRVERRDNHLRSNDFFATDSFPQIIFVSKSINKTAEDRMIIVGDLTVRGQTKTISIPSRLNFYDAERNVGRVTGNFVIDRHEYGVSYNSSMNPIEPEVAVQFDVAFQAKK